MGGQYASPGIRHSRGPNLPLIRPRAFRSGGELRHRCLPLPQLSALDSMGKLANWLSGLQASKANA
jgi:hypothetical protein